MDASVYKYWSNVVLAIVAIITGGTLGNKAVDKWGDVPAAIAPVEPRLLDYPTTSEVNKILDRLKKLEDAYGTKPEVPFEPYIPSKRPTGDKIGDKNG